MRSQMHHLSVAAARADALFVSSLQRSEAPTATQVRQAVAVAVRAFGSRGCAERVAQEFGDHPDAAVARMGWARAAAAAAFAAPAVRPARAPVAGPASGTPGRAGGVSQLRAWAGGAQREPT